MRSTASLWGPDPETRSRASASMSRKEGRVRKGCFGSVVAIVIAASLVAAGPVLGQATGAQQTSAEAAPRWVPPKTQDGQPDIQGYWSQRSDITTYSIQAGLVDREEHTRIGGQA